MIDTAPYSWSFDSAWNAHAPIVATSVLYATPFGQVIGFAGVPVPAIVPEPGEAECVAYPEWCALQQFEHLESLFQHNQARAENDATVAALNLAACPGPVLDATCDGSIDSRDFFEWYAAFVQSGGR